MVGDFCSGMHMTTLASLMIGELGVNLAIRATSLSLLRIAGRHLKSALDLVGHFYWRHVIC